MLYEKFGKNISEKFLVPYNEKLYACDLNMLDSDAMGRFFHRQMLMRLLIIWENQIVLHIMFFP